MYVRLYEELGDRYAWYRIKESCMISFVLLLEGKRIQQGKLLSNVELLKIFSVNSVESKASVEP